MSSRREYAPVNLSFLGCDECWTEWGTCEGCKAYSSFEEWEKADRCEDCDYREEHKGRATIAQCREEAREDGWGRVRVRGRMQDLCQMCLTHAGAGCDTMAGGD